MKLTYINLQRKINSNKSKECSLTINNQKFDFKIEKIARPKHYKIEFLNQTYNLIKPIKVKYVKKITKKTYTIYCYKNLLYLIQKNNFIFPYILNQGLELFINMNANLKNEILSSLNNSADKIIFENENISEFIITEQVYIENNNNCITNDNIFTDKILIPNKFGKYSNEYIDDINNFDKLFFLENFNLTKFMYKITYYLIDRTVFNFVKGNDKIGKTFAILFYSRLDNINIYFNIKKYIELEQNHDNIKIIKILFYEISKIFIEYKDYTEFATLFLEDIKDIIKSPINIHSLLIKLIGSIDNYFFKNKNKYNKLLVVLDEVEMDEIKKDLVKRNYNLIDELHKRTKVFLFILQ